jgi:hypothetical protein
MTGRGVYCDLMADAWQVRQLHENANYFRRRLLDMGLHVLGDWDSPVMPIMIYQPGGGVGHVMGQQRQTGYILLQWVHHDGSWSQEGVQFWSQCESQRALYGSSPG